MGNMKLQRGYSNLFEQALTHEAFPKRQSLEVTEWVEEYENDLSHQLLIQLSTF